MSPLLTITFVRHGESTDNLKNVWAGWKDAPLSNHGMNQARACGAALSSIHFKAIHASPLKRAFSTAQAIYDAQADPKPAFTTSPYLREQHFGIAEGNAWIIDQKPGLSLQEHYGTGSLPHIALERGEVPEGESIDDLLARAAKGIEECVMPHVWEAAKAGVKGGHIAVVSHGLCISAMVPALLRRDASGGDPGDKYRGLLNTAWTRVTVDVKGWDGKEPLQLSDNDLPPLIMKVTDFNRHEHLDAVERQKGGIGSAAYDPKQQDIRAFFGGAKVDSKAPAPTEEGRSKSNVQDEVNVEIQ